MAASYSMRSLNNAAQKTLEIFIYDDIGANWFGEGITADRFVKDLKDAGDVKLINLRINSAGGSVTDGNAIYNALKRNSARKEVDIDGMALSIASIIAMAGDEVRMAANAMFMIHDPWGIVMGSAEALRKEADIMDKFKDGLVNTYVGKTGLKASDVSKMMTEETWFTAAEAAQQGFVDRVTDEVKVAAHVDLKARGFKNIPNRFLSAHHSGVDKPRLDMARTKIAQMSQRLQPSA